jgi:hypothetical protein
MMGRSILNQLTMKLASWVMNMHNQNGIKSMQLSGQGRVSMEFDKLQFEV